MPRIAVAMLVPALGPFLSVWELAWIMKMRYEWTWDAAWYQSSERELSTAAIFTFPFLINSWILVGLPGGQVTEGSKLRGVDAPGFWRSLLMSTVPGVLAMSSIAFAAWMDRVSDNAGPLYLAAALLVLVAMAGGHGAARLLGPFWSKEGKTDRHPISQRAP